MSAEQLKEIIRQGEELASTLSGITDSWANTAKDVLEQIFGKDSDEYKAFQKRIQSRSRSFDILKQQQEWDNVLGLLSYCAKRGGQGAKTPNKSKPSSGSDQKYRGGSVGQGNEPSLSFTNDTGDVSASAPANTSYRKQEVNQKSQDESNRSGNVGKRDGNQNDQSANFAPVQASQPSEAPQRFRQQQRSEHSHPNNPDPAHQRQPEPQRSPEQERFAQAPIPAMNLEHQQPEQTTPRIEGAGQMPRGNYPGQANQQDFGSRSLHQHPENYEATNPSQFNTNNDPQPEFQQDRQPQRSPDEGIGNFPRYGEAVSMQNNTSFNQGQNPSVPTKQHSTESTPRRDPQGFEQPIQNELQNNTYQPPFTGVGESTAATQLNPVNDSLPSHHTQPTPVKLVSNQSKIVVITNGDSALEAEFTTFLAKLKLQPQSLSNVASTILHEHSDAALLMVIVSDKAPLDSRTAFQWGFFQGCLKGEKILTIQAGNVDPSALPLSSFSMNYDPSGSWKLDLIRALKNQGFEVDANLAF